MRFSFLHFCGVVLPTFLLLFLFSGISNKSPFAYQEVFGAGDYYLALEYRTNPDGLLSSGVKTNTFNGTLIRGNEESPVSGTREKRGERIYYSLNTQYGKMEGFLTRNSLPCRAGLDYKLTAPDQSVKNGRLFAGFCPGQSTFLSF